MRQPILMADLVRNGQRAAANRLRMLRRAPMDYVVLRLGGSFPERKPERRRPFPLSLMPWPSPPLSIAAFDEAMEQLAGDRRVRGAVLILSGLAAGPAAVAGLRQVVARFREAGKRAVAYLHELGMWEYYLGCACNDILAPEGASFRAAGLWSETLFLKDTLDLAGIQADLEAIAEYKVTPDTYRRSEMTGPHREMLESILDSLYGEVTSAVAAGRGLPAETVRDLFDAAPFPAENARQAGLLDGVCYEDQVAEYLGDDGASAALVSWEQASRQLLLPTRWHNRRSIGVISLEGLIVPGASRHPPFPLPLPLPVPPQQAGADTLAQQLRAAAADRRLAAVVLHVDSPGGSAEASDLIWREVANLRRTKPVVVYMGERAASGGYYVSVPANAIVAQPATLTGSIGIWGGKLVVQGLTDRVRAHREVVSRGQSAGLYSAGAPFTEEERARVRAELGAGYRRFKARVAEGRRLTEEQVEALARGRVWTGAQALACGLVDELGDFRAAVDRARELAGLDERRYTPARQVRAPKAHLLAAPPAAAGGDWWSGLQALLREGVLALAPWEIRIRG